MSILRRLIGVVFAAATLLAAPAALAQTYTIHRSFTAAGGVTGTATLEMANSTLTDADLIDPLVVPAELVSATLTFNNLGGAPASTTFNRGQLSGVVFVRDGGTIIDINFWAPANADGYALTGVTTFDTNITKGGYSVIVTTPRPPPPPSRPWANGR